MANIIEEAVYKAWKELIEVFPVENNETK